MYSKTIKNKEIRIGTVLKMTECDRQPVVKLSDSLGKSMCLGKEYLDHIKAALDKREGEVICTLK